MKKLTVVFLIITIFLSSCSMGDFCKISDVKLRFFNEVVSVVVDEGDDAYFYATKPLTEVCVYKMQWNYDNNTYDEVETVSPEITLNKNDALRIEFDQKDALPYVRITFKQNNKKEERYIYRDEYGKLWVLNQEI